MEMSSSTIRDLIRLSLDGLDRMQLDSGLFCEEIMKGRGEPRGRSVRYSLMVLLGLEKAAAEGYSHRFDAARIRSVAHRELDGGRPGAGDLGLALWDAARSDPERCPQITKRLSAVLDGGPGAKRLVGMEVAWIVTGLASALAHDRREPVVQLFANVLDELVGRRSMATGLLAHTGDGRYRARFPNFATQIYGILAFSTVAGLGLGDRALEIARQTADRLLSTRLPDGGWPWIFDTRTGTVVEPYEVYSVHQDAMAPMGLFALSDVSGDPRYAGAAVEGMKWIFGANELGCSMVDGDDRLVYRSIRRKKPWNRWVLYLNTGLAAALGSGPLSIGGVELNPTCRPYHLGWLLEAWCGRESLADGG